MATTEFRQRVSPKRILIVEDETVAALSTRTALTADGHVVDIAEDAKQALGRFQASQYDLVITDFQLPGMDGLELAELLKKNLPAMPIILITAHAEKIGGTMGNVSNVDVVVNKPFSVAQLQEAIRKVFPVS
jgi:CheY-like chemotaxis protein